MAEATSARVLTFHVDGDRMSDVVKAMDDTIERSADHPGFVAMLGLVDDSQRPQVLMISLWDDQGLKATASDAEEGRSQVAETADTGVTSRTLSVLRFAAASPPRRDTPR
jgi:hypothetical protein